MILKIEKNIEPIIDPILRPFLLTLYQNVLLIFYSYPVMEKADSKRRIAVNLFLVAFCGLGSMFVVYNVKKNLKNETQQNIYAQNSQRYQQDEK